jgi:leucyl aminopeptidase
MDVVSRSGNIVTRPVGALAIGVFEGQRALGGVAAAVDRATRGALTALLDSRDFTGRFLQSTVLYPKGIGARRLIVLGLGRKEQFAEHRALQVAAMAARRARELEATTLATVAHGAGAGGLAPERASHAVAEGSVLGHYRFSAYRTPAKRPLRRIEIVEFDAAAARLMKPAVTLGRRWAEAVCLARDLANTPGQDLTPDRLAERAREIARAAGARATIFGGAQLERLGMGAVIAVGRGSVNPPRFVVLERDPARGAKNAPTLVVIGKGVTFDTGGISLKPRENMTKMKYDMSGAAAVLGLFSALATIETPYRVVGLIPTAENMPGGRALKPGDIVRAMDGTTIEVTNTDAEGRLLLADALCYARRFAPEAVVDLATLTGAISIALGNLAGGLFTRDDRLAAELLAAGDATGERLWRMPLWDDYDAEMRGETADLVNSAAREGGAILAAVFLKHFARDLAWAHLDIASTAWSPVDRPHESRGPTGFGVRLLLEWISRRSSSASASVSSSTDSSSREGSARRAGRTRAARA